MKKITEEQSRVLEESIRNKIASMPDSNQVQIFAAALAEAKMGGLLKANSCTASIYCRRAKGEPTEPKSRKIIADEPLRPSQVIYEAERKIRAALKELELERDQKMIKVKELDDLISKYKHYNGGK